MTPLFASGGIAKIVAGGADRTPYTLIKGGGTDVSFDLYPGDG